MKEIKFTVFADFHYKKGMYIPSVDDMNKIFDRANESGSDFVIHLGDMCNDYLCSKELVNAYLNNKHDLSVYGIYGNHELESADNSMSFVTPLLTNREVVWGTNSGKIGNGEIGYYYFDTNGFRFIMTDTNYSWNPTKEEWEHNYTCSYGPPYGNTKICALGPVQLAWLEDVLTDAANNGIPCIVCSHTSFSGMWSSAPEHNEIRELFRKVNDIRKGTVLMAINGHLHTDHVAIKDDVVYFDVNTVKNGLWIPQVIKHYENETFTYTDYDAEGNITGTRERLVKELWMSPQTWYFTDPLSAVITVREDGKIVIDGMTTSWYADVIPPEDCGYSNDPIITSAEFAPLNER